MKRHLLYWLSCAVLAVTALAPLAHATPNQVSSATGEVRDLIWATGTTLYAVTQGGGLFKSTDSGANWSHAPGLPARYLSRVAVSPADPARVYVVGDAGLFRSTDSGTSWSQLSFDPVTSIGIDPSSTAQADTLLVGVTGVGIVKVTTANATPSFARASSGLDSAEVVAIEYQSAATAVAGLACNYQDVTAPYKQGNFGGVFRTTNNGTSWTNINTLGGSTLPSKCIRALAVTSSTIMVGTFDSLDNSGKVTRSVSLGAWQVPASGNPYVGDLFGVFSLKADRNSTTTFWGGSASVGLWKTTDSGASWNPHVTQAADPNVYTGINTIETIPGSAPYPVLVAPKGLGIFRNTSATTTGWTRAAGLAADRIRSLANHTVAAPNTYYAALENGGVVKSTDAGITWTLLNTGLNQVWAVAPTTDQVRNAQVIAAHPTNAAVVALGVRTLGLYTLSGSTWLQVSAFANQVDHKPQGLAFDSTGTAYYSLFDSGAATPGGLFRGAITALTSVGRPIYEAAPGLGVAPGANRPYISPNSDSRVFLLMHDSEPYLATDGVTFSRVTVTHEGFMRIAFYAIAERPGNQNVVVASTNKGIFRSLNGGANFSRISSVTGLTDLSLSSITYANDGKLFGGTLSGGFYCSKDDGTTWQSVSLGALPSVPVREVRYLNGQIHWLTDGGGIYKSTASTDCP